MLRYVLYLLVASILFFLGRLAFRKLRPRRETIPEGKAPSSARETLADDWSEEAIIQELRRLRDQRPAAIPHYIDSVVERFIVRQDDRTSQVRLQFLQTQFERLKLAKEFSQTLDDLHLMSLEREKRVKTLELETQDLDLKKKSRSKIDKLATAKERKKLELEIAQLEQQIGGIRNPPKPPKEEPRPSPEEQRAQERQRLEREIERLKTDKVSAMGRSSSEQDRRRNENMYDSRIEELYEQLKRFL